MPTRHITPPISPLPGQEDQSARLAASAEVGQVEDTTPQSIRKSSSRAFPAAVFSGISTHLNPGGADGACADGAAGSLNLASETPSLTPALIAEYNTQYVSSSPIPAAIKGNNSPNPINPTAASPSLEANDLKTPSAEVGQVEGTTCPHCGKALTPSADVFDRIAGFPFEKCSYQVEGTIYRPISEYLDWLKAELARLEIAVADPWSSNHPDADLYLLEEAQAALRVYMRFVAHRLGRA